MNEHTYTLQIIARDYTVANQLAVAMSGNAADALTFTEDYALPMMRNGESALAIEIPAKLRHYEAAVSFAEGGNPFGLHPDTNDEYRATMEIRAGDLSIRGTLLDWAASLGYEVAV